MDLIAIARRVASSYDFRVKMKLNTFVIHEIADAVVTKEKKNGGSKKEPADLYNDVAIAILESPIHKLIQELSESITTEADRLAPGLQDVG